MSFPMQPKTQAEIAAHVAACKTDPNDCRCDVRIVRCAKATCPRLIRQQAEWNRRQQG